MLLCAGIVLSAFADVPPAKSAGATIYDGLTIAQLKSILTASGKTFTDEGNGELRINDGPKLELTQCPKDENGVCYEIEIFRTFNNVKPTLDAVNKWNLTMKVPEASVTDDGELHMELLVTCTGLTQQLLKDTIGWFEKAWSDDSAHEFWNPYIH